jgi:alpha-galactosidase
MRAFLGLALLGVAAFAGPASKRFPVGWDGNARSPPLGWRSWNGFGADITQEIMVATIDALTAKQWAGISLVDVGYSSVGLDEGWEDCTQLNGSQHDTNGMPLINAKFSNLTRLVQYGHRKGLSMGWYLNGCACGEKEELLLNYQGDIKALQQMGWDAVKFDGCGADVNMTRYASLMEATDRNYTIENCHWGRCGNASSPFSFISHKLLNGNEDASSCPTADWCPMSMYRTSVDINNSSASWFNNLQTTRAFQDLDQPLSRPHCWAYPDMLAVGTVLSPDGRAPDLTPGQPPPALLNTTQWWTWNRAHFGAFCIVSSPLILGLDVTQQHLVAAVINIIANTEAIAM